MLHCRAMRRSSLLIGSGALLLVVGCNNSERIAGLEKQNQEMKGEISKLRAASDYDLQAKCSRDARAWFNENWSRDKNTMLLDFTNHYNKNLNKCLALVEFHFLFDPNSGSWTNDMTLWDIYENSKYGNYAESHLVYTKPFRVEDQMNRCEMLDKTCKTIEEFKAFVRSYMND